MCTSCLFIYLYRTIHRRVDFFYVKEHLPKCFINLHFKDEKSLELLNSSADKAKRTKYINSVEESFRIYWRLLGCAQLTGLDKILHYAADSNESDETRADYVEVENRCRGRAASGDEINQVVWIEADNWHESALRVCAKNLADVRSTLYRVASPAGSKRSGSKHPGGQEARAKISFNITFLVVALFSFFIVIFIYFKYYKPKKPCIKINLNNNSFRRLENPSQIRYGICLNTQFICYFIYILFCYFTEKQFTFKLI